MKIEPFEKNYFFNQCDPIIKNSLSEEQSKEVKRLLELSMQCTNDKATKINFNIWFFGLYFVTLYFGKEKRLSLRRFRESAKIEVFFSFIGIVFSFLFTFSMIASMFMALYYVKSFAGIDLFEDKHLKDYFSF